MKTIHQHCCKLSLWLVLCCTMIIVSGCSSIKTEPFQEFSSSMQRSSTAIDMLLAFNSHWAQEYFIHEFVQNDNARLSELKLKTTRNLTCTITPPPLFITLQQNREAIYELNKTLVVYTTLLLTLADKSLVNQTAFDKLAKNLNKNAAEAVNALAVPVPAQGVQLLSKASSEAMQLYLKHQQRSVLQTAIKQNQPNLEKYATSLILLLDIVGSQLKVYYSSQAGRLIRQWRSADHKTKIRLTKKMLELNQRYIIVLKNIRELNNFYTLLPQANRAMIQSMDSTPTVLPALIKLKNSASRLVKLQKSLKKYLPVKNR
ncbi:MAG: hypothetical protein L3J71_17485 [Victivallaceae bacterium]|nr:hypothetical protein [Victivallaceae bacterium]